MFRRRLVLPLLVTGSFSACLASYEKVSENDADSGGHGGTATGGAKYSGTAGRSRAQLLAGATGHLADGGSTTSQTADTSNGGDTAGGGVGPGDGGTGPIATGMAGGGSGGTLGLGGGIGGGGVSGTTTRAGGGRAGATNRATVAGNAGNAGLTVAGNAGNAGAAQCGKRNCASSLDNDCKNGPDNAEPGCLCWNDPATHPCTTALKGECAAGTQLLSKAADQSECHYLACTSTYDRAAEGCGPTFKDTNCNGIHGDGGSYDVNGVLVAGNDACVKKVKFCRDNTNGVGINRDTCTSTETPFDLVLFNGQVTNDALKELRSCSKNVGSGHTELSCDYIAIGECGNSISGTIIGKVAVKGNTWQMPTPAWPEYQQYAVPTNLATCGDGSTRIPKAPIKAEDCGTTCDTTSAFYVIR